MPPTRPIPGQVIRYAYLWANEHHRGQEEGRKDRPCVIVVAVQSIDRGKDLVTVLPVTHTPPSDVTLALEIPASTKQRLGMDDLPSWIILSEANRFVWPGPDVRPVPGRKSITDGDLPAKLFELTKQRFIAAYRAKRASMVPRTE